MIAIAGAGSALGLDGQVSGRVVDSVTGRPIGGVDLALSPSGAGSRLTTTSQAQGQFVFEHVKLGRYTLQGIKTGYARIAHGATGVGNPGRAILVASDRGVSGVEFKLTPLAAIAGKVTNRRGDAVPGATIACGFVDLYGAPPTMEPLRIFTDERGEFRITDMPPGRYYVQALPDSRWLPAFYPSVGEFSQAQPITLAPGQEAGGIHITVRDPRVFHVRGKVEGAVLNVKPSEIDLLLLPKGDGRKVLLGRSYVQALSRRVGGSGAIQPDGTFDLSEVEPGWYDLVAVTNSQRGSESLGRTDVVVTDRDVEGARLQIGSFVSLSFRLQPDPEGKEASCFLMAYPVDGDATVQSISGTTGPDGSFAYDRAVAGRYVLTARCKPEGWVVRSARLERGAEVQDVAAEGFSLRGSEGPAVVTLSLTRDSGTVIATVMEDRIPVPGQWVTLLPDPPAPGRVLHELSGWTNDDGHAVLKNVVPGDYRLYVWREPSPAATATNPDFLQRFEPQSTKVTVRAGETAQVQAKTIEP